MSALRALKAARAAGIDLRVDGQDLVLNAPAPPPPAVLDLLSRHKTGVIAMLRDMDQGWPADEWRAFYEERAAIAEFDGGLSGRDAEALAHVCCMTEWLNQNPAHSAPGQCLECGGDERAHEPLLPFGTGETGRAWLHHRCWASWHARRKVEAEAALAGMGIIQRSARS